MTSGGDFLPVETPDLPKLPYRMVDGVKEFQLIAEPVTTEFLPANQWSAPRFVDAWGYNGSVPGPAIEVHQGDRVRIVFENRLPEMTAVHWHGLEVPMEMDGVPGIGQDPVMPGGRYVYEFTVHQHGTFFYHSHFPMQEMLGMIGLFIIHPKEPYRPKVDRDFAWILQEWAILPNNTVPNTLSMEFNWLTLNGKAGPATTPVLAKQGERVRLRFVNLGMDHHPMHLHGNTWVVTGTEGGRIPESAWEPGNTVLVGVAQARTVEFEAKYIGDWMLHCHLPHHMMNQMVSMVGPMSHAGHGVHTGLGMQEGMGIVRRGSALSEELGPGLGRGLGETANRERPTTILVGQAQDAQQDHAQHEHGAQDKMVPGFPQDMWMTMDDEVAKPETYGLRPTWTGAMMGMMTLVRVLPPALYDKIMELKKQEPKEKKPAGQPPVHEHK
ncbi:MAG: copper oxidase [Acidobacteria bacterium]|nr:copper oxidase [Acidobacteriota bacterium]